MTTEIVGQEIKGARLLGARREYDDIRLVNSKFVGCTLAQFDDPAMSLHVRNVTMARCRVDACSAQGVFFEDVTIDTLRTTRPHHLVGCVLKHVTLRGKIGSVLTIPPSRSLPNWDEFVAGISDAYEGVDWALDIREAIFADASFYYVPGDLIRRDEDTQVLLRRDKFAGVNWRDLPSYAAIWASRFDSTPFDSIVAIAPKGAKDFRECMDDIEWLKKAGLVG